MLYKRPNQKEFFGNFVFLNNTKCLVTVESEEGEMKKKTQKSTDIRESYYTTQKRRVRNTRFNKNKK